MPISPSHTRIAVVGASSTRVGAAIALAVTVAACATSRPSAPAPFAQATLRSTTGAEVGTATFRQVDGAIRVDVNVRGVADGAHGLHIHTVGRCDPPAFASAGGHLNPDGHKHGTKNPAGPHAGDLPNVIINGGRSSGYTAMTLRVTNDAGPAGLFDADGAAIVLHADADDDMTDPAGNAGARIACGVIQKL